MARLRVAFRRPFAGLLVIMVLVAVGIALPVVLTLDRVSLQGSLAEVELKTCLDYLSRYRPTPATRLPARLFEVQPPAHLPNAEFFLERCIGGQ